MTTLHTLLDASLQHPPEYRAGLTSHLPMALHALHRLGAPDSRLEAFFATYAQCFGEVRPRPAVAPIADWAVARGRFDGFDALRATFALAIASRGREPVLREALPALWPGLAAAAFHGPIRLAHAAESGHDGELAAALAYWAARWQAVPAPRDSGQPLDFDDWAGKVEAASAQFRSAEPLISGRIREAGGDTAFHALAGRLALEAGLVSRLSRWAAAWYAETGNFTVLHMVTGLRALRVLLPWAGDPHAALVSALPALTAAALASSVRERRPVPGDVAPWATIVHSAIASDDDHVIKLVQACVELAGIDGEEAYRAAAHRAAT